MLHGHHFVLTLFGISALLRLVIIAVYSRNLRVKKEYRFPSLQVAQLNETKAALVAVAEIESRHSTWSLIMGFGADPFTGPVETVYPYPNQILATEDFWILPGDHFANAATAGLSFCWCTYISLNTHTFSSTHTVLNLSFT